MGACQPDWSAWRSIGYPAGSAYRGYFNRGFVISQFVSRYLDEHYPNAANRIAALTSFKADPSDQVESTFRKSLGGDIRRELLSLSNDW